MSDSRNGKVIKAGVIVIKFYDHKSSIEKMGRSAGMYRSREDDTSLLWASYLSEFFNNLQFSFSSWDSWCEDSRLLFG